MQQEDLTAADAFTLKRYRDSGDPQKIEAVRVEIARRLANQASSPGVFVSRKGEGE